MTERAKKVAKRNKNKKLRECRREKSRVAVQHEGTTKTVFEQQHPGYDVQMIRDFLEQLLLELRVQQYENVKALRSIRSNGDLRAAVRAAEEPSPALIEQLAGFHAKYSATLLPANEIDGEGATNEEINGFVEGFLIRVIEMRDAEIGHLEALQDVIDEALLTAKLPVGVTRNGDVVQPRRVHRIREIVDELMGHNIPEYDDLLPAFEHHPLATKAGIEDLQRASIVVAHSDVLDDQLVLYGQNEFQHISEEGEREEYVFFIHVHSFRELQFVLSAIRKFVGPPNTDGEPWKEL